MASSNLANRLVDLFLNRGGWYFRGTLANAIDNFPGCVEDPFSFPRCELTGRCDPRHDGAVRN